MPLFAPTVIVLSQGLFFGGQNFSAIAEAARASAGPRACLVWKLEPPSLGRRRRNESEAQQAFASDVIFNSTAAIAAARAGRHWPYVSKLDYFDPPRSLHFTAASGVNRAVSAALIDTLQDECPA